MCSLCYANAVANLSDRIRAHVARTVIASARERGVRTVRVKVGDVEREMGLRQRAPTVCRALQKRAFLREQGLRVARIEGPPSGLSPRVVLTYALEETAPAKQDWSWFDSTRGMLRGMWDDVGSGEVDAPDAVDASADRHAAKRGDGLRSLRGLLRGAFDEDGGGEAWLRKERQQFYDPGQER